MLVHDVNLAILKLVIEPEEWILFCKAQLVELDIIFNFLELIIIFLRLSHGVEFLDSIRVHGLVDQRLGQRDLLVVVNLD